MIKKAELPDVW